MEWIIETLLRRRERGGPSISTLPFAEAAVCGRWVTEEPIALFVPCPTDGDCSVIGVLLLSSDPSSAVSVMAEIIQLD